MCGASPEARAWTACAPADLAAIDRYRAVQGHVLGFEGRDLKPRRYKARHSAVTSLLLPAPEVVPWTITVGVRTGWDGPDSWPMNAVADGQLTISAIVYSLISRAWVPEHP